jgi:acyl carrier protein
VVLDSLPLTPNGKVDRKALPAPLPTRREPEDPPASPRTSVEEIIARVWDQVLRLDRCSIHDNFFESGGHSLLATQLILRLRETFNVKLPLSSIFESPTIAGLAIRVVDIQLEQANSEKLEEVLAELEHLSEADVKGLLNR